MNFDENSKLKVLKRKIKIINSSYKYRLEIVSIWYTKYVD